MICLKSGMLGYHLKLIVKASVPPVFDKDGLRLKGRVTAETVHSVFKKFLNTSGLRSEKAGWT